MAYTLQKAQSIVAFPMANNKETMVLLLLLHMNILLICHPALGSRPEPPSEIEDKGLRSNCIELASETEGPYWVEENIEASNVRVNLSYGVPLNLTFRVVDGQLSQEKNFCEPPIATARIDLWQCRWDGAYSDEDKEHTLGETWLRGYQFTNSTGYATFNSIYPGWYKSRTVHIHVRIRVYNEDNSTSYEETTQLFFEDSISDAILTYVYPYNDRDSSTRDTFNTNDTLFVETNVISLVGNYSNEDGYSGMVEFKLPLVSPMGGGGGEERPTLTK